MKRKFIVMIAALLFVMPSFAYEKYINFTQMFDETNTTDYSIENIYCFKSGTYYSERVIAICDYMGISKMVAQLYEQAICDVSTWTLTSRANLPKDFLTYIDSNSIVVTFNIDGTIFTITEYTTWNEYFILKRELKAYKCEINSSK